MGVAIIVEMRRATSTTLVSFPALAWLLGALALLPAVARPAPVADLYVAQVPAAATAGPALDTAFDLALRDVLVKLTGQRTLAADATAAVGPAAPLVQRYQPLGDGRIRVQFDAAALRRRLDGTNLPYWGDDRPRVLVWLAPSDGAGAGGEDALVLAAADRRGLPVVLAGPLPAPAGDPLEALQAEARRVGADAVLLGRPAPSAGSLARRWTLVLDGQQAEWPGDAAEGPEGAADRLAARYATSAATIQALPLVVSGIGDFDAYGRVLAHLRGQDVVESVQVERAAGDRVEFRLVVRGGAERLRESLQLKPLLAPEADGPVPALAGAAVAAGPLRYRLVAAP